MCWYGKYELKVAAEDITIYKIMQKGCEFKSKWLYSYFQAAAYILNKPQYSEILISKRNPTNPIYAWVNVALHSYSVFTSIKYFGPYMEIFSEKGYKISIYKKDNSTIVEGIIPKGSLYCRNKHGEYISNQLILTKVCVGVLMNSIF